MVTTEAPTRNFVLSSIVLNTGFFHPIPVSDDSVPVNLGRYEITYATLIRPQLLILPPFKISEIFWSGKIFGQEKFLVSENF